MLHASYDRFVYAWTCFLLFSYKMFTLIFCLIISWLVVIFWIILDDSFLVFSCNSLTFSVNLFWFVSIFWILFSMVSWRTKELLKWTVNSILRDSRGKYVIPKCEVYGARQSRARNRTRESHYFPKLSWLYFNERWEENRRHVIFIFRTTLLSVSIYASRNFYFLYNLVISVYLCGT